MKRKIDDKFPIKKKDEDQEKDTKNATVANNFKALNSMMMIEATEDTMIAAPYVPSLMGDDDTSCYAKYPDSIEESGPLKWELDESSTVQARVYLDCEWMDDISDSLQRQARTTGRSCSQPCSGTGRFCKMLAGPAGTTRRSCLWR